MTRLQRARLVRIGVAAAVVVLALTGMLTNPITPWAYLNAAGGVALTIAAWRLGLRRWLIVALLPLWQAVEVSCYYPWVDPGIPISMFVNPLLAAVIAPLVLTSEVKQRIA